MSPSDTVPSRSVHAPAARDSKSREEKRHKRIEEGEEETKNNEKPANEDRRGRIGDRKKEKRKVRRDRHKSKSRRREENKKKEELKQRLVDKKEGRTDKLKEAQRQPQKDPPNKERHTRKPNSIESQPQISQNQQNWSQVVYPPTNQLFQQPLAVLAVLVLECRSTGSAASTTDDGGEHLGKTSRGQPGRQPITKPIPQNKPRATGERGETLSS